MRIKKSSLFKTLCVSLFTLLVTLCTGLFYTASAIVIVIDPGHNAPGDPGACHGGVQECVVNAQLALKFAINLRNMGYEVKFTHEIGSYSNVGQGDIPAILPRRDSKYPICESDGPNSLCSAVNQVNPAAAISVHHNSYGSDGPLGLEVWYRNHNASLTSRSQHLGNLLHEECCNIYSKGRGVKLGQYKICLTNVPTVLFETGFLSTTSERAKIVDHGCQQNMANGMARAVVRFTGAPPQNINVQPSAPQQTPIMGNSQADADKLARFYEKNAPTSFPDFYKQYGLDLHGFCRLYCEISNSEGVRAEVAFAQAIHETGWFRFGGLVDISQLNFGGLGATGPGVHGHSFSSVYEGILAQVQHLKAYASTNNLNSPCVDPRNKYVKRGCAPSVESLGGKWAASPGYGNALVGLINKLLNS